MGLDFTQRAPLFERKRRSVLVTGAGGRIGSYFSRVASESYDMTLMTRGERHRERLELFGKVVVGELDDLGHLKEICSGIDTVVHLAGAADPQTTWSTLLEANIVGAYNVMVAAKAAGCRRVIYASSIHAVSGYPADVQVKPSDPPNPGDLYGVTKCFGESLARYMAEQEGLSTIAIRIGGVEPESFAASDRGLRFIDAWISYRDLTELISLCIDDERLTFAIFNGLSNNRFKKLDMSNARELLGFEALDDLTEINERLAPLNLNNRVAKHNLQDGGKSGLREELGL